MHLARLLAICGSSSPEVEVLKLPIFTRPTVLLPTFNAKSERPPPV